MALEQCLDWRTNSWIKKCIVGEEAMTCDECFDGQIDSINSQLRYLSGDVTTYESCYNLKTTTLAALTEASTDLEALVLKLEKDDGDDWQQVFTAYPAIECSYVPTAYCDRMTRDGVTHCQTCNGECVLASETCN